MARQAVLTGMIVAQLLMPSVASNIVSGGSGIQYVLTGWSGDSSGSGTTSNGITMNAPEIATASWGTQYYLTVFSAYGSPSPASGWFDAGSNINEAVTSPVPESIITQHVCTGWTGTGSAPATGTKASLHFTINQPSSITWKWESQFIWPMVLLLTGTPSAAVIIGLSIYLLRKKPKVQEAEMMLRAYRLVARAAFPMSHAQETTALDLIIIKLKITASFIVYKHK